MDRTQEIYHADAVLEFPQSGERFEGVANFREWRRQCPAGCAAESGGLRHGEDLAIVEVSGQLPRRPVDVRVQLLGVRDDKVARERIYVMEGWEAPEWRAPWRAKTPADPAE